MKLTDEDIIRMAKDSSPMRLESKVGMAMVGLICFIVLIAIFSPERNEPEKTQIELICEKIDRGEKLNFLEEKVLNDYLAK